VAVACYHVHLRVPHATDSARPLVFLPDPYASLSFHWFFPNRIAQSLDQLQLAPPRPLQLARHRAPLDFAPPRAPVVRLPRRVLAANRSWRHWGCSREDTWKGREEGLESSLDAGDAIVQWWPECCRCSKASGHLFFLFVCDSCIHMPMPGCYPSLMIATITSFLLHSFSG
jgi:hypothetical protein